MQRLTDTSFWEEGWWDRKQPERLRLYRDVDFEAVGLLAQAGKPGECRILELGGGASRILPYLARQLGFKVTGSDFSPSGCSLLQANLKLQNVAGDVVCEDLFHSSLASDAFDVVYSSGLIEHFDDTAAVVAEHVRLLKPGGVLVLMVPNLEGLQGKVFEKLAPPLWHAHRVFGPPQLAATLSDLGLKDVRTGYLGSFHLHIGYDPRWAFFKAWPRWLWFLAHASVRIGNGLISLAFRLSPWKPHTRTFSPSFFAVGVKPCGGIDA
jgi:SAM-dependent methyltransferase